MGRGQNTYDLVETPLGIERIPESAVPTLPFVLLLKGLLSFPLPGEQQFLLCRNQ